MYVTQTECLKVITLGNRVVPRVKYKLRPFDGAFSFERRKMMKERLEQIRKEAIEAIQASDAQKN